jgi:hypothetical protein
VIDIRYYKIIKNGYLFAIGISKFGGEEITKEEYENILAIVRDCPQAEFGYGYKLKTDLTWELYELPVVEVDENRELTDSEALDIILGGSV